MALAEPVQSSGERICIPEVLGTTYGQQMCGTGRALHIPGGNGSMWGMCSPSLLTRFPLKLLQMREQRTTEQCGEMKTAKNPSLKTREPSPPLAWQGEPFLKPLSHVSSQL